MHLLFMSPSDIRDPRGKIEFRANRPEFHHHAEGLPPHAMAFFQRELEDGKIGVFGICHPEGDFWLPFRATTTDFVSFTSEVDEAGADVGTCVIHGERTWSMFGIAYNERDKVYYAMCRGVDETPPHEVYGWFSKDGLHWRSCERSPLYHDHDAFSVMWHRGIQRYVCYQTTSQKWDKIYEDNFGTGARRVLSIRTSDDGENWDPAVDGPPINYWPDDYLITPDELDPPELEFYWLRAFPYRDRFVGLMRDYAPVPLDVVKQVRGLDTKHGPHMMMEWWVSPDGFKWERPYRDTHAIDATHPPVLMGDDLFFLGGQSRPCAGSRDPHTAGRVVTSVLSLPVDRIASAGCLANGEFSTPVFDAPGKPLYLNVDCRSSRPDGTGFSNQAYVMVEACDPSGHVLPGYERAKQILIDVDDLRQPLTWRSPDGPSRDLTEQAGQPISLRFYLRDARVYGVGCE
jgi:hypothetical protein